MNKNQYRIIFNAHRGVRMAVAETAVSQGKSASGDSFGLAGAGLVRVVFNLTIGASLVFMCGLLSPHAEAQIIADRNAPANQKPTVLQTASGLPQVNIQTPSAAGVSRNTYSQFDVTSKGAILNNSRTNTSTQIGGLVQGNPWLANGGARVILNEVNSSSASQIKGFVEVAGQRAEVIIANPAGIAVNGGGFMNASGVTLTTGTAVMNAGNLESFRVRGGTISVDGAGLDTGTADYTNLLARAAKVNAGIWAKDLKVVTGTNDIDAASSANPSVTATTAGTGTAPSFALDVASIGGMYAGKIFMVGTEAGLGVRNGGVLGATAGDVVITNDGVLTNSGSIYASGNTTVTTQGSITNTGRGLIAAQGNTNVKAQGANAGISSDKGTTIAAGMDSAGSVANTAGSTGTLNITAVAGANLKGQVASAADTRITGASIDVSGATIAAQNATLTASTYGVDATGSNAVVRSNWSAAAQTAVVTDGATVNAAQINIGAHELSNVGGKLLQNGSGDMAIVLPGSLNNTSGTIASNAQNLSLGAATITNTGGTISHAGTGTLGLAAGDLLGNAGTIVSNGTLQVLATGLVSLQGASTGAQSVDISAASLDNSAGHLQTNSKSGGQSSTGSLAVKSHGSAYQ